ncbi:MAG: TldD/PmbA family protein [Neomegalonema sp.]|nr:TldD/PmbA family protein [Neomegalonema sp.]
MFDDPGKLDRIAEQLLALAKTHGADAADVLISAGDSLSVAAKDGKLEEAERAEGIDFGLRVLVDRKQACVSASDAAPSTLETLAERAVAMASEAPEDPYAGLADPSQLAQDVPALDLADPAPLPSPEALLEQALSLEEATLAMPDISQAEGASASASQALVLLATSTGFSHSYRSTRFGRGVSAIAGSGLAMERDHAYSAARYREDLRSVEALAQEAAQRAARSLEPRKAKKGRFPVLFEPRVAESLIGSLVAAANGASVARGASYLSDRLGERVLPEGVDLLDDPLRPRGPASRPVDAEGLACSAKKIVEDGVLQSWLLDLASARKLGLSSNASASRGVGGPPSPSSSNLTLTPSEQTQEALLAQMQEGLFVTQMMGRGVDPVTGDYSRGAKGFWVENGRLAYPVSELTIAGHILDMLRHALRGNDPIPEHRLQVPSLLIEEMTIATQ